MSPKKSQTAIYLQERKDMSTMKDSILKDNLGISVVGFWVLLSWSPGSHSVFSAWSEGPQGSVARPSGLESEVALEEATPPRCNADAPCWGPGLTFWSVKALVMPRFDRASKVPSGSTIMSITVRLAHKHSSKLKMSNK